MNLAAKITIGVIASLLLIGGFTGCVVVEKYNIFVEQETGISAQFEQNKNNYDKMWKKFREAASTTTLMADDLERVYKSSISARYGEDGSQAAMQWLKEQNPNIDTSLYKNLQNMIDAGRENFSADQKMLIDKKRVYETMLKQFPTNLLASTLEFPKIDMEKMSIVTSGKTKKAFETLEDDEIKLK